MTQPIPRRRFLATAATATASAAVAAPAARAQSLPQYGASDYEYEVSRSEEEWRARLTEEQFEILRGGGTEFPTTSPWWNDYTLVGDFYCAGCDLHLYSSKWRAEIEQGWVFFHHSQTDAVLTGVDRGNPYTGREASREDEYNPVRTLLEVHCRRCGGHLGHIVHIQNQLVHCINGTAMRFQPAQT